MNLKRKAQTNAHNEIRNRVKQSREALAGNEKIPEIDKVSRILCLFQSSRVLAWEEFKRVQGNCKSFVFEIWTGRLVSSSSQLWTRNLGSSKIALLKFVRPDRIMGSRFSFSSQNPLILKREFHHDQLMLNFSTGLFLLLFHLSFVTVFFLSVACKGSAMKNVNWLDDLRVILQLRKLLVSTTVCLNSWKPIKWYVFLCGHFCLCLLWIQGFPSFLRSQVTSFDSRIDAVLHERRHFSEENALRQILDELNTREKPTDISDNRTWLWPPVHILPLLLLDFLPPCDSRFLISISSFCFCVHFAFPASGST